MNNEFFGELLRRFIYIYILLIWKKKLNNIIDRCYDSIGWCNIQFYSTRMEKKHIVSADWLVVGVDMVLVELTLVTAVVFCCEWRCSKPFLKCLTWMVGQELVDIHLPEVLILSWE